MIEAEAYYLGENIAIANRPKWKMTKSGKEVTFSKNITISNFFQRFVTQLNQFLLANGVQLEDEEYKKVLGADFDNVFEESGNDAQVHGVSYLFYNRDHVKRFEAAGDAGYRGFVPLLDEHTGELKAGIRFWQIDIEKPMYIELYEMDGVTNFETHKDGLIMIGEKSSYKTDVIKYPNNAFPDVVKETANYDMFPIVPFYANRYHRSEFTPPIKTKIDMYDKISSDFGDNLERTNDILWVISNFGGTTDEIKEMIAEIGELGATYSQSDGSGNSSVMPHTIEVPYAARQIALKLLEDSLYADFMAMNFSEISGGSLTNVAIDTAKFNLNTKCNRFEYQAYQTVRRLLQIAGIETENIKFRRQAISNQTENITNVLSEYDRGLLDKRTALEKLDNVDIDEVDTILDRLKEDNESFRDNGGDLIFNAEVQKALEAEKQKLAGEEQGEEQE